MSPAPALFPAGGYRPGRYRGPARGVRAPFLVLYVFLLLRLWADISKELGSAHTSVGSADLWASELAWTQAFRQGDRLPHVRTGPRRPRVACYQSTRFLEPTV